MHKAAPATLGVAMFLLVPCSAHASGDVVVKYAADATAKHRTAAADRAGVGATVGRVAHNGARIVRVSGDPAKAAATLSRSSTVEYAEVNGEMRILAVPDDARFGELWGLDNANDADIDAPAGWDAAGLGAFPATGGVKVGIVDTGIDADHEDLVGKTVDCAAANASDTVVEGECDDGHGHGTHVAGTIAAKANNGAGVAGVAFNSQLSICRALDASGSGTAAGGNSTPSYPAAYPEVVSVAATDNADAKASFSTFNDDVEVAAPGVNVLSTQAGGGYVAYSGTSMATPHAAGVAALIAGSDPDLTPAQVRTRLAAAVDDKGAPGRDPQFGFGRLTLEKAF